MNIAGLSRKVLDFNETAPSFQYRAIPAPILFKHFINVLSVDDLTAAEAEKL